MGMNLAWATATAGCAARSATGTGAASAPPGCWSPTAPGCCCSTGRPGPTRATPGRFPAAPATVTRSPSPRPCAKPPRRPRSTRPVVAPFSEWVDEHGGWSYTTIVARTGRRRAAAPTNAESTAVRVVADRRGRRRCRCTAGFAAAWPAPAPRWSASATAACPTTSSIGRQRRGTAAGPGRRRTPPAPRGRAGRSTMAACDWITSPTRRAGGLAACVQRLGAHLGAGFTDGGLHPSFGTRNFVLPLADGCYLEVVAALDHPAADRAPFGRAVRPEPRPAAAGWPGRSGSTDIARDRGAAAPPGRSRAPPPAGRLRPALAPDRHQRRHRRPAAAVLRAVGAPTTQHHPAHGRLGDRVAQPGDRRRRADRRRLPRHVRRASRWTASRSSGSRPSRATAAWWPRRSARPAARSASTERRLGAATARPHRLRRTRSSATVRPIAAPGARARASTEPTRISGKPIAMPAVTRSSSSRHARAARRPPG